MGLKDDIQSALTEAFSGDLSDVVSDFSLFRKSSTKTYDSATDTYTQTETEYESQGIFGTYPIEEIDGTNIKVDDEKIVINAIDIDIAPRIDDRIALADGTNYLVIKSKKVVGGLTGVIIYIVQVRK